MTAHEISNSIGVKNINQYFDQIYDTCKKTNYSDLYSDESIYAFLLNNKACIDITTEGLLSVDFQNQEACKELSSEEKILCITL